MSQDKKIEFQNIRIGEEIGTNYIRCILQDKIGFLWFGTTNGLYKYDGYELSTIEHDYNNSNSLSNNYINCLTKGKDGTIWIGTRDGLSKYDPNTKNFTNYYNDPKDNKTLCNSNISTICEDEDGKIWVGTPTGLDLFDTKTNIFTHFIHNENDLQSISNNQINKLFKDKNGNILIGTDSGGLNKIIKIKKTDIQSKTAYKFQKLFNSLDNEIKEKGSAIYSIYEDRTGALWIGLAYGFIKYNPATNYFKFYEFKQSSLYNSNVVRINERKDFMVRSIVETNKGLFWFATTHGLYKFDENDESLVHFWNISNNYPMVTNNTILDLLVDRSGILWIGTKGSGINKLLPGSIQFTNFSNYNKDKNKINVRSIRSFLEDSLGNIWVGGYFGIDKINTASGKITHYLAKRAIYTMCNDSENPDIFWMSLENEGLFKFNSNTGKIEDVKKAIPQLDLERNINCLVFDTKGYLWFGSEKGLSRFSKNNGALINFKNIPRDPFSLSNNGVRAIYEDKNGYLWIGTDDGLNLIDQASNKIIRIMHTDKNLEGLSERTILSIYEDQKITYGLEQTAEG